MAFVAPKLAAQAALSKAIGNRVGEMALDQYARDAIVPKTAHVHARTPNDARAERG